MKPQSVKPQAQTDWLGFCKGVRTCVQRAALMRLLRETGEKATICSVRRLNTCPESFPSQRVFLFQSLYKSR